MTQEHIWYFLVYLAEALIVWQYAEYLFPRKHSVGISMLLLFGTYIAMFLLSLIGNTEVNIASFFLLNLFLFLFTWHTSWKTALLHSALLIFLMSISEILFSLFLTLFGFEFDAYTTNETVFFALVVASKLLYFLLSICMARIFKPHQYGKHEPAVMLLFCILPLLSVAIVTVVVFVGSRSEWDKATNLVVTGCSLSLLMANMVFAVLYHYLQKTHAEQAEMLLSVQKAQADAKYYQDLHEMTEMRRSLLHDMNKHFRTLALLAEEQQNEKILEYLCKLDQDARLTIQAPVCNHPILNMLLLRAQEECRQKQIDLDLDIREGGAWFIDPPDTTALLGNLISNAIEAAETSSEKRVSLSIQYEREREMFIITTVNSCAQPPKPNGKDGFLSRKSDQNLHGFGLRNIDRVVKRYQGISMMYYNAKQKEFHSVIQFAK